MNNTSTTDGTFEYQRAIYNTYNHVAGHRPEIHEELIDGLLPDADTALDSRPGFFFDTIATTVGGRRRGMFVLGFEDQKGNRRERFFDLYFMQAEEAATVSLADLVAAFDERRMTSAEYDRLVEGATDRFDWSGTVHPSRLGGAGQAPPSQSDWGSDDARDSRDPRETAGTNTDPAGDTAAGANAAEDATETDDEGGFSWDEAGDDEEDAEDDDPVDDGHVYDGGMPADLVTVAELYDRHRRDATGSSGAIPATINELDTLVDQVDGALANISFVSPQRNSASYFDFAQGSREESASYEVLVGYLQALRDEDCLQWDRLPSYRDEVEYEASRQRTTISAETTYQQSFADAKERMDDLIEREVETARAQLTEAVLGELDPPADDSGRLPSMSVSNLNPFGGDDEPSPAERNVNRVYAEIEGDIALPDEQLELLAQHIAGKATERVLDRIHEKVIAQLEEDLRRTANDELVALAVEAIDSGDAVVRTESYRRYQKTQNRRNGRGRGRSRR